MVEPERSIEQLQVELHRQQRHMALLREVALASRGGVDPQQFFQTIYERLAIVLPIDAFFVALCDNDDVEQYHFALFIETGQHYELPDKRVGGLTGHLLMRKQSVLLRDLHTE